MEEVSTSCGKEANWEYTYAITENIPPKAQRNKVAVLLRVAKSTSGGIVKMPPPTILFIIRAETSHTDNGFILEASFLTDPSAARCDTRSSSVSCLSNSTLNGREIPI